MITRSTSMNKPNILAIGASLLFATGVLSADEFHTWAPTPPMGCNSWDCSGTTVTEKQTKEQAGFMVEKLKSHGWTSQCISGAWPDADMLSLGIVKFNKKTGLTPDEQHTLMTLWSIARSPLMHGGDITKTDDFTLTLLTNDEVFAANQRSENTTAPVPVKLTDLGFAGSVRVRDLWEKKELAPATADFAPEVPFHGARLFRLRAAN
jgi:Alpha galactosidase C-terminal beta sandwich domain/Alpha galactosidase A